MRKRRFKGYRREETRPAYKPGVISVTWQKMRVLQRRDFVIGGYTPAGRNFGAILIGDYEARALKYVAKVHGGFTPTGTRGRVQAVPRAREEKRRDDRLWHVIRRWSSSR